MSLPPVGVPPQAPRAAAHVHRVLRLRGAAEGAHVPEPDATVVRPRGDEPRIVGTRRDARHARAVRLALDEDGRLQTGARVPPLERAVAVRARNSGGPTEVSGAYATAHAASSCASSFSAETRNERNAARAPPAAIFAESSSPHSCAIRRRPPSAPTTARASASALRGPPAGFQSTHVHMPRPPPPQRSDASSATRERMISTPATRAPSPAPLRSRLARRGAGEVPARVRLGEARGAVDVGPPLGGPPELEDGARRRRGRRRLERVG